ncbi:MAG: hypothetical protein ABSE06_01315 [Anaerolineaceae bacterium]|jgi:hypothetical protein
MKKITKINEIWTLSPTQDDLKAGADYAAITLPWTFNRMSLNTSSTGQQGRGLNIAKGIVAQEMLHRALEIKGLEAKFEIKSYRNDDLFDFQVCTSQGIKKMDIKSFTHYKDYDPCGREPLFPELIINNIDYPGPDWRHFFPMLIPHTQIRQGKEIYCFAIADSIDIRKKVNNGREYFAITAYPYDKYFYFLGSRKLCLTREAVRQGIYLSFFYNQLQLFELPELNLRILGEWDGKEKIQDIKIQINVPISNIGPFSCISSFQILPKEYLEFNGQIKVEICKNELSSFVYNSKMENMNVIPNEPYILKKSDFCNLMLPQDYILYVVGWIPKNDFLQCCRKYPAWVWPDDKKDKFQNQAWSQITDGDIKTLTSAGFDDCIQKRPSKINAGWMKTTGRGNGAACYYFPNIFGGGIKETNLYILPQDLYPMDELRNL